MSATGWTSNPFQALILFKISYQVIFSVSVNLTNKKYNSLPENSVETKIVCWFSRILKKYLLKFDRWKSIAWQRVL